VPEVHVSGRRKCRITANLKRLSRLAKPAAAGFFVLMFNCNGSELSQLKG
jgi:hypothetical protein